MNKYFIANGMITHKDEITADQYFLPLPTVCNLLNKLDNDNTQLIEVNKGLKAFNRNTTTDTEVLALIKLAKRNAVNNFLEELDKYILRNYRREYKTNKCVMDNTLLFRFIDEHKKETENGT